MTILIHSLAFEYADTCGPASPLNALWLGKPLGGVSLPHQEHLLLVFPQGESSVSLADTIIPTHHYLWISSQDLPTPCKLHTPFPANLQGEVLVLWLSPPFIAEIASFLQIPPAFNLLLQGVPLLQGDRLSTALSTLAVTCRDSKAKNLLPDLFLEVVGEFLQLLRLRHLALQKLVAYKKTTITDLLPRLLRARQYIEARFTSSFTNKDVAATVGLSEYHFARLFKKAFDVSVRQMVIRLRLDTARRTLAQGDTAVTETAYAVGYQSLSAFINAFRHAYGYSPSEYQRRMKNAQE